ncbi:HAD family phosphatase [Shewanella sp. FJAT-51649]|uniref:HAD family hydrolase n=1 Tax=Shewanella sp. FJAT-51649 TaxID=2864210 RepID=UPI001C656C33|nr:HAD family phosphatase [Shewanella sp. FJAT-51649]QYJ71331.1 HAD family phosphatase [Shewanella sp. FJAT-51649]
MKSNNIKNVIFDIGNVFVRWSPIEICRLTFGDNVELSATASSIFNSDIWLDLNKGFFSESKAKQHFIRAFNFTENDIEALFFYVKESLIPIYGTQSLLERVKSSGYNVFALTDNVTEIIEHLQSRYTFWPAFDGVVTSCELGVLKPNPEIYQHLFNKFGLEPAECVFLDDMQHNIQGAKAVGMHGIQFLNATQCEDELITLGLTF